MMVSLDRLSICRISWIGLLLAAPHAAMCLAPACVDLTAVSRARLTTFVAKLMKSPADTSLELLSAELDKETCYRRLEFRTSTSKQFTLFLSPDQRFLTPQLFDSSVDPVSAEQKVTEHIKALIDEYIEKNRPPILGPMSAPITIAVFSDFQCPFCRRGMRILEDEVLVKLNARIAYINFPLLVHPWAMEAAVATACVGKENTSAFWRVHDYLFGHQAEMTVDSIAETVLAKAKLVTDPAITSDGKHLLDVSANETSPVHPHWNIENIEECVRTKGATKQVQADVAFGSSLGITVTPTLFINGKRVVGVASAKQILEIVETPKSPAKLYAK
jgi:protein-disulfide isomerase